MLRRAHLAGQAGCTVCVQLEASACCQHVPSVPLLPTAQQLPPPHPLCSDPEAVALLCRFGADLSYSVPSVRHRKTSVLTAALLVEDPEARSQIVLTLLQV